MRWALWPHERPPRDGQYFVWNPHIGKCVMGYRDGFWGGQAPDCWLENDTCPHQAFDGSFSRGSPEILTQPMDLKAYPIEDEL